MKSDAMIFDLDASTVEERRRGEGRSSPSELVRLHIVAVNSHPACRFFLQAGGAPGRMSRAILRWEKPGVGLPT